jgi:hypothetical protein
MLEASILFRINKMSIGPNSFITKGDLTMRDATKARIFNIIVIIVIGITGIIIGYNFDRIL